MSQLDLTTEVRVHKIRRATVCTVCKRQYIQERAQIRLIDRAVVTGKSELGIICPRCALSPQVAAYHLRKQAATLTLVGSEGEQPEALGERMAKIGDLELLADSVETIPKAEWVTPEMLARAELKVEAPRDIDETQQAEWVEEHLQERIRQFSSE